jgi:hypothetical protein
MFTKEQIENATLEMIKNLNLTNWNIKFEWRTNLEDGADAEVTYSGGRRHIFMRFSEERMLEHPAEHIWHIIAHECIHIHLSQLRYVALNGVESLASTQVYNMFFNSYELELERTTDTLANVVTKVFLVPKVLESQV